MRTRTRTLSSGRKVGGIPFTNGPLNHILRNRVYLGEINHQGESYKGEHHPLIDTELFNAVQARLSDDLLIRQGDRLASDALLAGKLYDDRGNRMSPTYAIKKGVRYRYYVSTALIQGQKSGAGAVARVPATDIEQTVGKTLRERYWDEDKPDRGEPYLIEQHLERVTVQRGVLELMLKNVPADEVQSNIGDCLTVPWTRPALNRKRELLLPAGYDPATTKPMKIENRVRLLKAIRNGMIWLDELIDQKVANTQALAQREKCSERTIRLTLSLAFLAPDLVKAAVGGKLPRGLGLTRLTELPPDWTEQRRILGIN